jgi:hypothetical protein
MPVTICPSPEKVGHNVDRFTTMSHKFWHQAAYENSKKPILHSSFHSRDDKDKLPTVVLYLNGFVKGAICAFQQDLNLLIRPDNVWPSIITQFNLYVDGHAEELRSRFVAHSGKEALDLGLVAGTFQGLKVDEMPASLRG